MTFGIFEAATSAESELKLAADEQALKLNAAIYDVKQKYGPFLFASTGLDDFDNRVALVKEDMIKTVQAHLAPVTGIMRRVVKAQKAEYKRLAGTTDTTQIPKDRNKGEGPAAALTKGFEPNAGEATPPTLKDLHTSGRRQAENTGEAYIPEVGDFEDYIRSVENATPDNNFLPGGEGPTTIGNPESNFTASRRVADDWGLGGGSGAIGDAAGSAGAAGGPTSLNAGGMNQDSGTAGVNTATGMDVSAPAPTDPTGGLMDNALSPVSSGGGYGDMASAPGEVGTNVWSPTASINVQMYQDWCAGNGLRFASIRNLEAYASNVTEPAFREIERVIQAELIKLDVGCETDHNIKNHKDDERFQGNAKRDKVDSGEDDSRDQKDVDTKGKNGWKDRKAKPSKATEKKKKEDNAVPMWGDRKRQGALSLTAGYRTAFSGDNYDYGEMKAAHDDWEADQIAKELRGTGITGPTNRGGNDHEFKNSQGADIARPQDGPARHRHEDMGWSGDDIKRLKGSALELTAGYHTAGGAGINTGQQLQKAGDEITELLNGLAEEFQASVAPLQQALQSIQYAQSVQQQANPLGVMPGGGLSVLPPQGQDGSPPLGQAGFADPAAMGGAPAPGGPPPPGDPAAAAGGPPMDPAAAGGPPPAGPPPGPPQDPTQMMARRKTQGPRPFESASRREAWQGWGPAQPKRHVVAGWDWNDRLNGFETTARRDFECSCGQRLATPGFHNCGCGKIWNSYAIGSADDLRTSSATRYIAREIPVRENVIMANRRSSASKEGDRPIFVLPAEVMESANKKRRENSDRGYEKWKEDTDETDGVYRPDTKKQAAPVYDYPNHPAGPVQSAVPLGMSGPDEGADFAEPSKWEKLKERVRNRPSNGGFAGGRSARTAANPEDNWVYNQDLGGHGYQETAKPNPVPYHLRPGYPREQLPPQLRREWDALNAKQATVERRDVTKFDREGDGYQPADVKNMRDNPSDWWKRRSDGKWTQGPNQ